MRLPIDLRVALFPFDTYRELVAEPVRGSWRRALERLALVAVIVGTAVTMSSARRVPLGLVAMGIVCWIAFQTLINLGGITRSIPLTGVPLPFLSYGGSSLIMVMAAVGVLLNVSRYGRDRTYTQRSSRQRLQPSRSPA